jgi:hypothetical protein
MYSTEMRPGVTNLGSGAPNANSPSRTLPHQLDGRQAAKPHDGTVPGMTPCSNGYVIDGRPDYKHGTGSYPFEAR